MTKISQTEIVDLLNTNKNNLSALKDMNIISEYFKLLGARMWIYNKATDNDILLPEIESLLEYYNYNCQFTESGIFVGTEKILGCAANNDIEWKKGKNYANLCGSWYYSADTVGCNKWIRDFTELSENEKLNISSTALEQIQHPGNNIDMSINEIVIYNTITSGVEVSKKVMEEYCSKKNKENWISTYKTLAYSPNNPTINYEKQTIASPYIQSHLEEYIEKMCIGYTSNPSGNTESVRIELPNYGNPKLHVPEIVVKSAERRYDYEKLYIELMEYHQKHPLDLHPIFIYAKKYPDFERKYLQGLSEDFDFYEKMIASSTNSEDISTLTEVFRRYRLAHPYEIHPRFFEIDKCRGNQVPNISKEQTEEHFKKLCLK